MIENNNIFPSPDDKVKNPEGQSGSEQPVPEQAPTRHRALKPVKMTDIAKAAGVSQGAISSLLNDRDYGIRVSPQTRDRVIKVCREMGYVPGDLRAMVRVYPELGETCLLVSTKIPGGLTNPYVARVAAAMMAKAPLRRSCISIALYDETKDYRPEDEMPWPIKNGMTTRLIFLGPVNRSIFTIAEHRENPIMLIGHLAESSRATGIVPDYLGAARSALETFARNGHRRVGIAGEMSCTPEPQIAEMDRAIGIASQELGLPIYSRDIHRGGAGVDYGVHALSTILAGELPPTGVFCLDAGTANGILAGAQARGISVPGQLSVIALSDHDDHNASRLPLTSVVLPVGEMATAALDEADRQIAAGIPSDPKTIVVPARLLERMTCGAARH